MVEKHALRVDRLKDARERLGWSQRELAERCHLSITQVNKYEKAHVDPSATYLKLMAETLGVSADYLLGLTDNPVGKVIVDLDALQQQMLTAMASRDFPAMLELVAELMRREPGGTDRTAPP